MGIFWECMYYLEAAVSRCSLKKVFLKNLANFTGKNENEMKWYFFQHVQFTSYNFYKVYMLGKKT